MAAPVLVAGIAAPALELSNGVSAGLTGPQWWRRARRRGRVLHTMLAPVPLARLTPAATRPRGRLRTVAAQAGRRGRAGLRGRWPRAARPEPGAVAALAQPAARGP